MLYLIRHGQAGSRDNYDVLSELGRSQAALLGEYLASKQSQVSAVYSGTMARQAHTAEIVGQVLKRNRIAIPDTIADEKWNEISLAAMYRAMAPRMRAEDPDFDRDLAEMQVLIQQDPHSVRGATGRCDAAVMRAWMSARYPDFEGESWADFRSRIKGRIRSLAQNGHESTVLVFTSATPIATLAGHALDLDDERVLKLAGVIYNTSITLLAARAGDTRADDSRAGDTRAGDSRAGDTRAGDSRAGDTRLVTFNSAPHLSDSTKTFR